jgi:hypothetical protein
MITRATNETLAFKKYEAFEISVRKLYSDGEINSVQLRNRLNKNLESLLDKEQLSTKGEYCLVCDCYLKDCKCKKL